MSPQAVPGARASRSGLDLDADIEAGIAGTRARNEAELLGMAAPTLDNNPGSIDPSFSLTPDQQRSLAANQPDPVAVMELQQALAREEAERFGGANRVGYGPGGYFNSNGELVIEITRGANPVESVAVSTNASALGISDEAVDAAIAAGETSAWDAAGYAARTTGYEVWNFLTAGFVKRHDARLTSEANGQLSTANLWRATAFDAVGSVGSLYLGGRAGAYAFGRLGAGYAGYMGSGAAGGAVFDLTQQGTQLGINAITGGQAGQEQFSLNELAIATSSGAVLGGALRFASTSPLMNRPLQSPLYFDLQGASTTYMGIPIGVRSPFVAPSYGRFANAQEFADAAFGRYQQFVDEGYDLARAAESRGRLSGAPNTRVGNYVDRYSRDALNEWLEAEGIAEGVGSSVQMNRWLRDPLDSGAYSRPDIRIPGANLILDATVGWKWSGTPQISNFQTFSGGNRITIVRPTQLGGSYSIVQ